MKLLYDHQIFAKEEYGGISRYFLELMWQFRTNQEMEVVSDVALHYSNNKYLMKYPFLKYYPFLQDIDFLGKGAFLNQINKPYSIRPLLRGDYDLVHPTYYDPYFIKYLRGKPFLVTVHDMIHEIFPQYFPFYDRIRANKRTLTEKAGIIIAVSKNTKQDLLTYYDLDPEKIVVIYHGNPFAGGGDYRTCDDNEKESYLLFVGNRQNYKNFPFFISAISPILENHPEVKVICAGGGEFTPEENTLLEYHHLKNRVFQVQTDDQGLRNLYSKAMAFIFPSLYEGFGIPVLEAFACGCPAILSNTSSLPEVGGDAALYFNPTDPNSLLTTVLTVLEDESTRNQLIHAGLNRVKNFSWEKTAWETKEAYKTILD